MKKLSLLIVLACVLALTGCDGGMKTGKPARDDISGPLPESYQAQKKSIAEQSAKTKAAMSSYTTKATPVGNDTFLLSDSEASNATKKATLSSTRSALGLGTGDNPSFNSVHASGGNLAAANKQVTKAWQPDLPYTAGVTSVIHGGQHYICTITHTSGSTTEPGIGAGWATVWKIASGGTEGGNIDAGTTAGDIPFWSVALSKYVPTGGVTLTAVSPLDFNTSTGELSVDLSGKQDALVSGTNIKTINNIALPGSGNISISSSLSFDTFPTYEDSAHTSGIAVNGTTLAIYSSTAGKWLTVGLTDSLDPTPVMYTLTVTDPGNNDVIYSNDSDLSATINCGNGNTACSATAASGAEITGISANAASGREWLSWGGDVTGSAYNDGTVTMSSNKACSATFGVYDACSNTAFLTDTVQSNTWSVGGSTSVYRGGIIRTASGSVSVCSADFYLNKSNSLAGKTVYVERWSTNSGDQSLVTKQEDITSFDADTLSTTLGFVSIEFGKTVTLNQYDAIVLTLNEVPSAYMRVVITAASN